MPLDPEIAAFLESQKRLPPRSSLDIEATRAVMRRNAELTGFAPALAASLINRRSLDGLVGIMRATRLLHH
jgi:hypothetical protein